VTALIALLVALVAPWLPPCATDEYFPAGPERTTCAWLAGRDGNQVGGVSWLYLGQTFYLEW
jgi:hypothetical protein